jgi:hypothetical protein
MKTKTDLKKYLSDKGKVKIVHPQGHKYFGIVRKADKVQTNAIRFEGGSWLYFNEIEGESIYDGGFSLKRYPEDSYDINYELVE